MPKNSMPSFARSSIGSTASSSGKRSAPLRSGSSRKWMTMLRSAMPSGGTSCEIHVWGSRAPTSAT